MTRKPDLLSIDCKSCGAGLDVLGGGRVVTHICAYCGACLKADEEYRVLAKFDQASRPNTGFEIGQEGDVAGVRWRIIGILAHEERHAGRVWNWVDHQLFSPTHGYAFLTVEKGHLIFTRKWRKAVGSTHSPAAIENAENRPKTRSGQEVYDYYEYGTSRITFAEGEFNWVPQLGQETISVTYMSKNAILAVSQTENEREIYRSTYLDQDAVAKSFGVAPLKRQGVHALQPYKSHPDSSFVFWTSALAAFCLAVLSLIFWGSNGSLKSNETHKIETLPTAIEFELSQDELNALVWIELSANVDNAWAWTEIEVWDPEDELVFETGRLLEAYSGVEDGERWKEGSGKASIRFQPTIAGRYQLDIDVDEAALWKENASYPSELNTKIRAGLPSWKPVIIAAGFFYLLAGLIYAPKGWHQRRRWAGSDWSED